MIDEKKALFSAMVEKYKEFFGKANAPQITDAVMQECFPETLQPAKKEGAIEYLRAGINAKVAKSLKKKVISSDDFRQLSLLKQYPDIFEYFDNLSNERYYIPSLREYVTRGMFIKDKSLIIEAANYLEAHADATAKEARLLRQLYEQMVINKI